MENNNKIMPKVVSGMLLCTMVAYTTPILAYTKDETVYSKLKGNGENYQTIVSTHLENNQTEKVLKDLTDLLNIKNTNGDESFSQEGNTIVWNSNGEDIYYQGESQKSLPVTCKITYELDGKEISAEELAGKSGKVKIKLQYTNQEEHLVNINGKNVKMYTPFVVVAGTLLSNDTNQNINITNGKVLNDGSKTIVVGIAMPGMQESLGVSHSTIEIPDMIEISMDATDFQLNSIASFITPKILEEEDLDGLDKFEELYHKINTLESSSKQLADGANTLKEGTTTYYEKSQEFNHAMQQIEGGVNSANQKYTKINEGIGELNNSSVQLSQGAKKINEGAQAIEENLEVVSEKLGTIKKGSENLEGGIKKTKTGVNQIAEELKNVNATDNSSKIKDLNTLITANENTIKQLKETNAKLESEYNTTSDTTAKETIQKQIQSNKGMIEILNQNVQAEKESLSMLQLTDSSSIETLKQGIESIQDGLDNLATGAKSITTGADTLQKGTDILVEKSSELTTGSTTLYQGTQKLQTGTNTLVAGSSQMKSGLNTISTNTNKLKQADDSLTQGAKTLKEGSITLAEGIQTFNQEGIQTICSYINGDLKNMTTRADKLLELSEEYNHFTMLQEGESGSVKFIMLTDEIKKKEQDKKEQAILNDDSSQIEQKEGSSN